MPYRKARLTDQQSRFVEHYAVTADAEYAAHKAGYSHPHATGYSTLKRPGVPEAIEARRAALDESALLLPAVLREHGRRLLDPGTTNREFAALAAPFYKVTAQTADEGAGKELHERSAAELDRLRERLIAELAERSKPILELQPEEGGAAVDPGVFE